MQRVGFTLQIKPGTEEEYKRRHDEIWPEMLEAIRAAGIRNYTIFRQGTTLFNYLECDNWPAVLDFLADSDVSARWGEYMSDILEPVPEATLGRFPPLWEEVFHVD